MQTPKLPVFNFKVSNQDSDTVDIHVDGDIVDASTQEIMKNWWGDETSVSFKSFRNQIEKANPKTVNIYVNSPGGHVGDAMAMHDYLVELENKGVTVNRIGRGIIASAATYLIIGNNSSMSSNSMMMIHNVSMVAYGDINQCENQVKAGRKFNDLIRDFYSNQTGKPKETISSWMNKETWFTASEAKENGFVKNIGGETKFSNSYKPEQWPFQNTAILNQYNSFTQSNSSDMDIKKITDAISNGFASMLDKLGLKDKADDDNVKNALDGFVKQITDSLSNAASGISNEDLQKMVNTAVSESFKNIAENEAFKTAITNATSGTATKKDLADAIEKLTNSLVEKLGGGDGHDGKESKKNEKRTYPKNRFSGQTYFEEN